MKKILITGANSYIGTSIEKWLLQYSENYKVDTISVKGNDWLNYDFGKYDSLIHIAGIAHRKETEMNKQLYFEVNRDLAFNVAKKSKADGLNHFIFFSTMNVYGLEEGVIDANTPENPKSSYGKSKLEAEKLISELQDDSFKLTIIRPPMVYGENCKGNYQRLRKLAIKSPFFPKIHNERSMIYIDNLSEFVRIVIDKKLEGICLPQNNKYVSTYEMVKTISEVNKNKIFFTKIFNPLISIMNFGIVSKVFGNLIYDSNIFDLDDDYNVIDFKESIIKTEKNMSDVN